MPEVQGLGPDDLPCYGGSTRFAYKGSDMAHEEELLLASPPSQEMTAHVDDYERFTRMIKFSAIACLIVGFIVLLILK